ncbi:MAG: hypothetical protein RLZZ04_2814 [Cyanobacteriota bacterium]|jgi:hypothetical protein
MLISKIRVKSLLGMTLVACSSAIAFPSSSKAQDISTILTEASTMLNQDLPMKIDQDTQWDSTFVGPGQMINYNYTLLNYSLEQLDVNQFASEFRPFVDDLLCEDPGTLVLRENDIAVGVNVYDQTHNLVSRITVAPNECR